MNEWLVYLRTRRDCTTTYRLQNDARRYRDVGRQASVLEIGVRADLVALAAEHVGVLPESPRGVGASIDALNRLGAVGVWF